LLLAFSLTRCEAVAICARETHRRVDADIITQHADPALTRTWLLDENTRRAAAFVFSNARGL
jgi:hypothetical protein